ncbi:uncharacterized protein LOC144468372 isoform X2 [Augochlora pura]
MYQETAGQNEDTQINKKQLLCRSRRNVTEPVRSVGQVLHKEHMDSCLKLLKFVTDSDLPLTQVNGQRKLGPPPKWKGPPPNPKCEVFVGKIPRDFYEPEIVKIFGFIGQIYELRLMMNFCGENRGYCFIMYTTEEEAARAVEKLDQFEIYPGKKIGVVASLNNRRLYIVQLPPNLSTEAIVRRFYKMTDDIEKVAVYRTLNGVLCYVLVSYNTHRGAAMGRRRLVPESLTLFPKHKVFIEWANPNMSPWNVLEECGTCDEAGNVKITKAFLVSSKPKKSSATNKLSTPTRPLKPAPQIASKTLDYFPNPCTLEQCQSDYLAWQNGFQIGHWNRTKKNAKLLDVNGNLKTALDQYLQYENMMKNGFQNQSSRIFPSINSFLRKRRGPMKLNGAQKYADEAAIRRQIGDNPPDTSFVKNYANNCQCLSRNKKPVPETRNPNWNTADNLTSNVSRVLLMSNGNQRQIILANDASGMVNVPAGHALVHPNQYPLANHAPYGNYYQNYTVAGPEQNDPVISGHLASEIPGQCNGYDARPSLYQQEPSRDHFSQAFDNVVDSDVHWAYPYSVPNQVFENRGYPELYNGVYYQTNEPQNARDVAYYDNEISRGSIFSSTQNFDDTYSYKAPGQLTVLGNDGILAGNEQSKREYQVEEKCGMRAISKTNNADVKVNY